jgi:hypothetical protein
VVAVGEAATAIPAPERHDQPSLCDQAWICVCGNQPHKDGFCPCNSEGKQVKPAADEWTTNRYVCGRCERIINMVQ